MPEWLYPIMTIIVGVLAPSLTVQWLLHQARNEELKGMRETLTHIDECVDSLKVAIVTYSGRAVTREEVDAALLRMREAVGQDTRGLHDRITRLETPYFVKVS